MDSRVFRPRDHDQVVRVVVLLVPIDVMDVFMAQDHSSDLDHRHVSMEVHLTLAVRQRVRLVHEVHVTKSLVFYYIHTCIFYTVDSVYAN